MGKLLQVSCLVTDLFVEMYCMYRYNFVFDLYESLELYCMQVHPVQKMCLGSLISPWLIIKH